MKTTHSKFLLRLPSVIKQLIVIIMDLILILVSVWLAFYMRIDEFLNIFVRTNEHFPLYTVIWAICLFLPIAMSFGLYKTVFRYSSVTTLFSIGQASLLYGFLFSCTFTILGIDSTPRTIGIIQPIVLFILVATSRVGAGFWLKGSYKNSSNINNSVPRVLIYGAGTTGQELLLNLINKKDIKVIGFLDDDKSLHDRKVYGFVVYNPQKIASVTKELMISEILLAMPSIKHNRRREILDNIRVLSLSVKTLPSYYDLINGRMSINDLRDLSIGDILGREVVTPDPNLMMSDIKNKVVLVTGAGGSIGSELCRQIIKEAPRKLVLFEQSEFALYTILRDLENSNNNSENSCIIPALGSVTNEERIKQILREHSPNTIYHTAAYKHVPLVEENPIEAINNNIFGTLISANAAISYNVEKFVLISTDKAVRPPNVMGATKRVSEIILQRLSLKATKTSFAMVRFGNVLDSSGSVVPLFRDQIKTGGPITLTHKNVTRYFMTIAEAAQLVIQAGAMTKMINNNTNSAPVYLLDMGEPIKIHELALLMIQLSGLREEDIEVKITGLRPGEKLYEELLVGTDAKSTSHPKIRVAQEEFLSQSELDVLLFDLSKCIQSQNGTAAKKVLSKLKLLCDQQADAYR
jgi:FlaA1/EpsC-like NDP-sugar epimerase